MANPPSSASIAATTNSGSSPPIPVTNRSPSQATRASWAKSSASSAVTSANTNPPPRRRGFQPRFSVRLRNAHPRRTIFPSMETEIMTLKEVADYLRLSEKTVTRMAQEGRIPAQKLARQWRFQRSSVASWLVNRATTPADEQQLSPEATRLPAALTVAHSIMPARINLNLTASDKNGILRELCVLVLDPHEERLFETQI